MLKGLGRTLENIGDALRQKVGLLVIVAAGLVGIGALFLGEGTGVQPAVLELTLNAVSTQSNLYIPTIAAQLTRTPQQAALTAAAPTISLAGRQEIRQYAASVWASSDRGLVEQGPAQAAGPPNTEGCIDSVTAYAPDNQVNQAVMTLYFPQVVTPTGLVVYESFNPGYISRIEMTDLFGEVHVVYDAIPQGRGVCQPLAITIPDAEYQANVVTIYLDKTNSPAGWNQIDAVELIGIKFN